MKFGIYIISLLVQNICQNQSPQIYLLLIDNRALLSITVYHNFFEISTIFVTKAQKIPMIIIHRDFTYLIIVVPPIPSVVFMPIPLYCANSITLLSTRLYVLSSCDLSVTSPIKAGIAAFFSLNKVLLSL